MSVTEQGSSDTANDDSRHDIQVSVETEFLPDQSDAEGERWVFAYHISIHNQGSVSARLLTRHWVITDGEERVQEVHGEGVIGEQPHIAPRPDLPLHQRRHTGNRSRQHARQLPDDRRRWHPL